ncbi:hypothetical protein DM01DRAFT_1371690 [Hesseltinella vesiculosa]|uniref:Uncharacterized protein n=1 Tax=Hesseltinella vesiculosa TaxID=101127 RepID=A0A1X2GPJ3_9FUNG|nr:hypothetical protein DM01DRAFT_1371690 [Hesseltinella vesiculosa]
MELTYACGYFVLKVQPARRKKTGELVTYSQQELTFQLGDTTNLAPNTTLSDANPANVTATDLAPSISPSNGTTTDLAPNTTLSNANPANVTATDLSPSTSPSNGTTTDLAPNTTLSNANPANVTATDLAPSTSPSNGTTTDLAPNTTPSNANPANVTATDLAPSTSPSKANATTGTPTGLAPSAMKRKQIEALNAVDDCIRAKRAMVSELSREIDELVQARAFMTAALDFLS